MHPCPCCGYATLPGRGNYDVCPVCWWEDDGVEPWEFSGPNGQTPVEGQQEYLAKRLPHRLRRGRVRPPRRHEARDPQWRPYELTDDLRARVRRTHEERRRRAEQERRRVAQEIAADPEVPFKEYNAAIRSLRAQAGTMPYEEVKARMRDLGREHHVVLPEAHLELLARTAQEDGFYRRHPVQAVRWLLRYGRPRTYARHWRELRSGTFRVAG